MFTTLTAARRAVAGSSGSARLAARALASTSTGPGTGARFQSSSSTHGDANSGIVGGPKTEVNPEKNARTQSASSSSAGPSADPTSKEVLASEAKAEADASLTRHRAEGDALAAGVVSGVPPEMARRPVRIFQPSQESTQSAKSARCVSTSWAASRRGRRESGHAVPRARLSSWDHLLTWTSSLISHNWIIDWDTLPGGNRWENATMGWASSADYMQGTSLKFNTKGACAIRAIPPGAQQAPQCLTPLAALPLHRGRHPVRREAGLVMVPAGAPPRQVCAKVVSSRLGPPR